MTKAVATIRGPDFKDLDPKHIRFLEDLRDYAGTEPDETAPYLAKKFGLTYEDALALGRAWKKGPA